MSVCDSLKLLQTAQGLVTICDSLYLQNIAYKCPRYCKPCRQKPCRLDCDFLVYDSSMTLYLQYIRDMREAFTDREIYPDLVISTP
jgi:hypothetical protein